MGKYNYLDEEAKLRFKLRRMKIIATSLLLFMTLVFIVFKRFEDKGLFFSSVSAFAEASMVGALADWFAVVALFKHPMGLKFIPHTAIIQNNKKRIAAALSNFVVSNFFTPEIIKAKLDKTGISIKLSSYIEQNKETIAAAITEKLPLLLNSFVDDTRLEDYLKEQVNKKVKDIKLYPLIGTLLEPTIEMGYHKPVVKGLLDAIYKFIEDNKEKTMLVLGGINKTFTMPFIGDLIYKKILEFMFRQVEEIDTNDKVEINQLIISTLPRLLEDMQNSQELIEKGELVKEHIINSVLYADIKDKVAGQVIEFKNTLINNKEELLKNVTYTLDLIVKGITENNTLRERIDSTLVEGAEGIVTQYGNKVGSLIYDTMDSWETKDMVDKLEVQVGADLQYIRINGTVIGGLAGLAIRFISLLF